MKRFTKKSLAVLLAVVLVLSLSVSALAAWPSFQKDQVNNGTITTGTPPIEDPTTVTTYALPTNGTINVDVFSGVSTPLVMDDNSGAYALFNGGFYNPADTSGGARIAGVDTTVLPPTPDAPISPSWTYSLDARADNVSQLSTMYLDTSGEERVLYAAVTRYYNELSNSTLAGWTNAAGTQVASPITIDPGDTKTIYYSGLVVNSDFWQPQIATDIESAAFADITATVILTPSGGGTPINWGSTSYWQGKFTVFNNSGVIIPAGEYDIEISITVGSTVANPVTWSEIEYLTSRWSLYKVSGFNSDMAPTSKEMLATGYGQANTPIYRNGDASDYLYFGIWEGDRSYYQYDAEKEILTAFEANDDFYWAGAVAVTLNSVPHVAFGGDNGVIYARPVGMDFGSGTGYTVDLSATEPDVGNIRSTIVLDGTNGYLTSVGAASGEPGYLWRVTTAGVATAIELDGNSVSTPVLSANGYLYVGWYDFSIFPAEGGVQAVYAPSFSGPPITIYSGDPVQSSAIVYSTLDDEDYIFFTTNSDNGLGYCYYWVVGDDMSISEEWAEGGTSTNRFTLQGFSASSAGYLVYGDDGNTLYIMEP